MESILPKWVVNGLGGLLIALVALLIVQKANDLTTTFKNQKPANTMSVSAEGKVQATPDLATITIGVLSQGTDAVEVKNQNNTKVNKVIDYIKKQGVAEKDITTSQYSFYPQQDWKDGTARITGYQGNQDVTVKVHGVDKSQDVINKISDGAVNAGANQINGVFFSFEDPNELQQQARKEAIAKAKEKAQELAREAGLTLGKVVSVSESSGYIPGPVPMYALEKGMAGGYGGGGSSVAPSIQPGSQDVTQTMIVVFEIK